MQPNKCGDGFTNDYLNTREKLACKTSFFFQHCLMSLISRDTLPDKSLYVSFFFLNECNFFLIASDFRVESVLKASLGYL